MLGAVEVEIRHLPDAISLDVARNLRAQSLEALHAALDDWRDSSGTGNYRWICARWVLRCIKDFRWHDAHAYRVWRETVGNRRAA